MANCTAADHDRPVCFLAHTVKGSGTPIAGHKDNPGELITNERPCKPRTAHVALYLNMLAK